MDYSRIYSAFIADRRGREALLEPGTFDRHHILPRCLGGGDEPENIIRLSHSDHLFAHVLLARIHGGGLAVSANRMSGMVKYRGRRSRERYSHLRLKHRRAMANVPLPDELKRKISEGKMGWDPSPETRARMSASAKARSSRGDWRREHSERMTGNKNCLGHSPSPETRKRISDSLKRRAKEMRDGSRRVVE